MVCFCLSLTLQRYDTNWWRHEQKSEATTLGHPDDFGLPDVNYRSCAYQLISPGDISLELFDQWVLPVLSYGCEVWGFGNITQIEILYSKYIKILDLLGVANFTPNQALESNNSKKNHIGRTCRHPSFPRWEWVPRERFERFERFLLQKKHNAGLNMRHKHGNQTITASSTKLEGQYNTL